MATIIEDKKQELEKLLGYEITLDDYFTGIEKTCNGNKYFNIMVKDRTVLRRIYNDIQRIVNKYPSIISRIEMNGYLRIALFLD